MKVHSKDQIETTANSIMKHFIPKDPEEKTLSFHFTIPPSSNYRVSYEKNNEGVWVFIGFVVDEQK